MIPFNSLFIRNINYAFTSVENIFGNEFLNNNLSLENNNVFSRFLVTRIDGDEVDIPVIARRHIESNIFNNIAPLTGEVSIQTLALPLYENTLPQEKKTFDSFIMQFFYNTNYSMRIQKIVSNKGEVYYGGKGLIFDDKYNPLLICTLRLRKVVEDGTYTGKYFKHVIYVSPIVFMESGRLINRGIIKKLIPYCTGTEISFPSGTNTLFSTNRDREKAIIVVDDLDKFFVKPTVPKPQDCITESLNECLVNNVDDVLSII